MAAAPPAILAEAASSMIRPRRGRKAPEQASQLRLDAHDKRFLALTPPKAVARVKTALTAPC